MSYVKNSHHGICPIPPNLDHVRSRRRSMEQRGHVGIPLRPSVLTGIFFFLSVAAVFSPAAAQSSLKSRRDINVGKQPVGAIAVDFDGDGFPDLITSTLRSQDIAVNLGSGGGSFAPTLSTSIFPITPSGLAVGDWN